MNLFRELRRRSVFKVGAAYLVLAWLLAQIVVALKAPLHLPEWFDTVVVLLLALGFPVAILFAWAYELTPVGLKRTDDKAGDESKTRISVHDIRMEQGEVPKAAAPAAEDAPAGSLMLRDFTWVRSAALPKSSTPTVGREDELASLRKSLEKAKEGAGRIVLVTGEPGIGKTQMLRAFADEAGEAGATVLFGLCYEEEGAPSYFPWLQIMQAAGEMTDQPELLAQLAAETEAMTASESSTAAPTNARSGLDTVRGVMYHATISRLVDCLEGRQVVILFDNLHWADAPSLKLLEFLGRVLSEHPILVVATYQDIEITRTHPLFATLTTLGREAEVEKMRLQGLDRSQIQALATRALGKPANDKLVDEILRTTDGNPFFVSEVVRGVAEELRTTNGERIEIRVPDGIHETIGRRLDRLSTECNDLLSQASVLGRTFETRQLEKLAGLSDIEVLSLLEEAMAAAIVQETDKLGHFQFTHALITETLYDELPMSRRVATHREAAQILEELHADNIEPFLGQIARHYHHAARSGEFDKAIEMAIAAARYAERIVAYEDAVSYYGLALEMIALDPRDRRSEEAELRLAQSNVRAKTDTSWTEHGQNLEAAMNAARESGNHQCLIEATCQYVFAMFQVPSLKMIAQIDDALSAVKPGDFVSNARLLARKAAVMDTLSEHRKADVLVQQAIEEAEKSGDAWCKCDAFGWASIVLRSRPDTLSERIHLAEESIQLALSAEAGGALGQRGRSAAWAANEARRWLMLNCQEAGDTARVKELIQEFEQSSDKRHYFLLFAEGAKAYCALLEGRWAEARGLITKTYEVGRGTDSEGAEGVFGAQMFHLFRELGRLREVQPVLQRLDSGNDQPVWLCGLAILHVEVGNLEAARRTFDQVFEIGLDTMPRDAVYVTSLAHLAETCAALGDRERAGEIYRALTPYSGQMATHPTAVCLGPVDRLLGMMARLLRAHKEAREYFARALELCETAQSKPWTAHTKFAYAQLLRDTGDGAEAEKMTNEAGDLARQFGMGGLMQKIETDAGTDGVTRDRRATT